VGVPVALLILPWSLHSRSQLTPVQPAGVTTVVKWLGVGCGDGSKPQASAASKRLHIPGSHSQKPELGGSSTPFTHGVLQSRPIQLRPAFPTTTPVGMRGRLLVHPGPGNAPPPKSKPARAPPSPSTNEGNHRLPQSWHVTSGRE
jgi:hypothetical protein